MKKQQIQREAEEKMFTWTTKLILFWHELWIKEQLKAQTRVLNWSVCLVADYFRVQILTF